MVDLDLRRLSAPIEALRNELSEAYERLDAKWAAIHDCLKALPIPVDVEVTYQEDIDQVESSSLAWIKWSGRRRICTRHYHSIHENDQVIHVDCKTVPYEEWSGGERRDLLNHVPGLFNVAKQKTQEFINDSQN